MAHQKAECSSTHYFKHRSICNVGRFLGDVLCSHLLVLCSLSAGKALCAAWELGTVASSGAGSLAVAVLVSEL